MWNLKYDPEELILQNGNRLTDVENRPVVPKGERGGGGRDQGGQVQTITYRMDNIRVLL